MQNFGHDALWHVLLGIFGPEADGATVLCTATTATALDGVLQRNWERAEYVYFFAIVIFTDALNAAIDNACHVWNCDRRFCNVGCKNDSRAFCLFENAVLRFSVLTAVEFKELGDIVAQSFARGGVTFGNFCFTRQEYERCLPNVIAVQSAQCADNFAFDSLTCADVYACGGFLVKNLYGIKRMPEFQTFDAERLFHFFAVELCTHDGDSWRFDTFTT